MNLWKKLTTKLSKMSAFDKFMVVGAVFSGVWFIFGKTDPVQVKDSSDT